MNIIEFSFNRFISVLYYILVLFVRNNMYPLERKCINGRTLLNGCLLFVVVVSKNLSERRSTKSDMSPVSLRSALPSGKPQNRVSQVLQVQVPLNPLRKKSTAKDIGTPS